MNYEDRSEAKTTKTSPETISQTIEWKKKINYFDNQLIVWVIYQEKNDSIVQLQACFSVFCTLFVVPVETLWFHCSRIHVTVNSTCKHLQLHGTAKVSAKSELKVHWLSFARVSIQDKKLQKKANKWTFEWTLNLSLACTCSVQSLQLSSKQKNNEWIHFIAATDCSNLPYNVCLTRNKVRNDKKVQDTNIKKKKEKGKQRMCTWQYIYIFTCRRLIYVLTWRDIIHLLPYWIPCGAAQPHCSWE